MSAYPCKLMGLLILLEIGSTAAPNGIHGQRFRFPRVSASRPAPEFIDATAEWNRGTGQHGYVAADIPLQVMPRQPFEMDIALVPFGPKSPTDSTRVYLEQSATVKYQPRTVSLRAGDRRTVRVEVNETRSGLSEIAASADKWNSLRLTINSGFKGHLRSDLSPRLSAGQNHTFTLQLVDPANQQLQLDAPVEIQLRATEALFLSPTGGWTPEARVQVSKGASSTGLITLRPRSSVGSAGQIMALMYTNDEYVVSHALFPFAIAPAWWVSLSMTLLGGLLYSILRIVREYGKTRRSNRSFVRSIALPTLISGLIAGTLAYLLASWDVLGFQVDTTSLRGFVVLGLLFAYVGIDTVLDTFKPKAHAPAPSPVP